VSTPEARFVELFKTWLVSLPHDLKIAIEAMDDENLPRSARELAVGAIMYVVSPNDFVSDRNEAVASYADDAILLRLALRAVVVDGGEDGVAFRERFSELFDGLDEDLKVCRGLMGDLMTWLEGKVAGLRTQNYKGKKLALYLDNEEAREIAVRGRPGVPYRLPGRRQDHRRQAEEGLDGARRDAPPPRRRAARRGLSS
jgi:uncharacterized membrane protein YkvA (DUF1232 family)